MAKPKLRGSSGGKIQALAEFGVAKPKVRRASGSTWVRSRGTLGRFWEVQGQGRPPEKFRGRFSFSFPGRKNMSICQKNPFLLVRPKPVPNNFSTIVYDQIFPPGQPGPGLSAAGRAGLVGSRQFLHVVTDFPFYGFLRRASYSGPLVISSETPWLFRVRRPGDLE